MKINKKGDAGIVFMSYVLVMAAGYLFWNAEHRGTLKYPKFEKQKTVDTLEHPAEPIGRIGG